jgi:hypothetical protein
MFSLPLGFTATRVRVIFQLLWTPVVEWFKSGSRCSTMPDLEMFQVSWSTRQYLRRTSIIPITQIHRSLHLTHIWRGRRFDAPSQSKTYERITAIVDDPVGASEEFALSAPLFTCVLFRCLFPCLVQLVDVRW